MPTKRWTVNPLAAHVAGIAAVGFGAVAMVVGAPLFVAGSVGWGLGLGALGAASFVAGSTLAVSSVEGLASVVMHPLRHVISF